MASRDAHAVTTAERLEQRLVRLAAQVSSFWGLSMAVTVAPGPPSTDWNTVFIPPESHGDPDEALLALLLHEWGHRTIAPVSVAQAHWWEILARIEGIQQSQEAVNMATDLLVDRWYLKHPLWGPSYAEQERTSLLARLEAPDKRAALVEQPLLGFFTACYVEIGGWHDSVAGLGLGAGLRTAMAKKAVSALLDESLPLDDRVRGFLRVVAPLFEPDSSRTWRVARRGTKGPGVGPCPPIIGRSAPWRRRRWDASELVRLLVSSGLRVPDETLESVCGPRVRRQVRARIRVLESLVRVEPHVQRLESKLRSERFEGSTFWRVGESIRELQPIVTLERSGVLLPGVTTLRRRYFQTRLQEPQLHSCCLIVDNSGSTQGAVIENELDAAVALLEACRRQRSLVSLVVFGSHVAGKVEPGHEYDRVAMMLAGLEGQSGGTELAPALLQATRYLPKGGRQMATVIFTDSYIFDTWHSMPHFRTLTASGPVVLFCVADHVDDDLLAGLRTLDRPPRIVQLGPGQALVDEALRVFDLVSEVRARH